MSPILESPTSGHTMFSPMNLTSLLADLSNGAMVLTSWVVKRYKCIKCCPSRNCTHEKSTHGRLIPPVLDSILHPMGLRYGAGDTPVSHCCRWPFKPWTLYTCGIFCSLEDGPREETCVALRDDQVWGQELLESGPEGSIPVPPHPFLMPQEGE